MSRKRFFRVSAAVFILLLLLSAGATFFLLPEKASTYPDFSSMPTDTAGNNMIGNLPENLASGGFMAGQNGWIYFANFSDGGKLYMCRENGADLTKLTDFAVCNINVLGTSVVFTGFEHIAPYAERARFVDLTDEGRAGAEALSAYTNESLAGGKLYVIYGLHPTGTPRFCVIDPDAAYFRPYLDLNGLYAVCADGTQSILVNKISGLRMVVTREGEAVKRLFSYGDILYAELFSESARKSRVMRIDAQTLFPLDYINGDSLYRLGNRFVFRGEDGYMYELAPSGDEIKPVSGMPVDSVRMNAFGEITALYRDGADGLNAVKYAALSREQWYGNLAEVFLSRRKSAPITMQNGWYSYHNVKSRYNDLPYFQAGGNYYSLGDSGWSAAWLNTKLDTEPLCSLDDLIVEDLFTPTWLDFSEGAEPIDPAGGGDFGSERPVRIDADDRADAANDARNALDAAILLLTEDDRIADKYTGESVELLRIRYGDAFEAALTDAADKLSRVFKSRFGIDVSPQEARDNLMSWLKDTSYEIGGVQMASNGKEAGVALTVQTAVNLDLLYSMLESEDDVDSAYAEIMREPPRNSLLSSSPESVQIYMSAASAGCWIAEGPDKLIRSLVCGLD